VDKAFTAWESLYTLTATHGLCGRAGVTTAIHGMEQAWGSAMSASVDTTDHVARDVRVSLRSPPRVWKASSRIARGLWSGTVSSLQRVRPKFTGDRVRQWWSGSFAYWPELETERRKRLSHLNDDGRRLKEDFSLSNSQQIAAADLFVEKAEIELTIRARIYAFAGTLLAISCFLVLAYMVAQIMTFDIADFITDVGGLTWQVVVLTAFKAAGLAGFAGAAVYFAASSSRAFFHESAALLNRRHALRFGRMYVYLKYGETSADRKLVTKLIRDFAKLSSVRADGEAARANASASIDSSLVAHLIHRDVRADELQRAFGWNVQVQTAFRDMKAESMSANVYSRTLEELTEIIESVTRKTKGADDPA
jgi:hypothetical protein